MYKFLTTLFILNLCTTISASKYKWIYSLDNGPGTLNYWAHGKKSGSQKYWEDGIEKGSAFFWYYDKKPGSKYYWKYGKGAGSLYYWKNGKGPYSKDFWEHGKTAGSKEYWETQSGASFDPSFISICLGSKLTISPCKEIKDVTPSSQMDNINIDFSINQLQAIPSLLNNFTGINHTIDEGINNNFRYQNQGGIQQFFDEPNLEPINDLER